MNKENTKVLFEKYPIIFRGRNESIQSNLMSFGFECGDGWFALLDKLCATLTVVREQAGIITIATQVKEKFGGLRFYVRHETDQEVYKKLTDVQKQGWAAILDQAIRTAENMSYCTCEVCGEWGTVESTGGWISTLCTEHRAELKAKRKAQNDEREAKAEVHRKEYVGTIRERMKAEGFGPEDLVKLVQRFGQAYGLNAATDIVDVYCRTEAEYVREKPKFDAGEVKSCPCEENAVNGLLVSLQQNFRLKADDILAALHVAKEEDSGGSSEDEAKEEPKV